MSQAEFGTKTGAKTNRDEKPPPCLLCCSYPPFELCLPVLLHRLFSKIQSTSGTSSCDRRNASAEPTPGATMKQTNLSPTTELAHTGSNRKTQIRSRNLNLRFSAILVLVA